MKRSRAIRLLGAGAAFGVSGARANAADAVHFASLDARGAEKLAQSDIAVGRMRRLLREEAVRQITARTTLPELSVSASLP